MPLHTEWDTARSCEIGATSREDANENWDLDQAVDEPFVLVLGGGGGGCLAVEGARNDLVRFGFRVLATVNALPLPGQGVLEAVCGECAETFNPEGPEDLTHAATEDGSPCGGEPAPREDPYRVGYDFVTDTLRRGGIINAQESIETAGQVCDQMAARRPEIATELLRGCSDGFRDFRW